MSNQNLEEKTYVFLVTVDDLRADHLGYMGYKKNISPNIDSFAKKNIVYTNALSNAPQTTISFPSILYGVYATDFFDKKNYLKKRSIATVLKENGYKTLAFNSNPHFKMWGFSKGFDYFEDFLSETRGERDKTVEKAKKKLVKKIGKKNILIKGLSKILTRLSGHIAKPYADAELMNKKFFEEIDKKDNQKIFCWMHYMDLHYPFLPPTKDIEIKMAKEEILRLNRLQRRALHFKEKLPDDDVKKIIALYDAEIRYLDSHFNFFIDGLKKRGIYDKSIIIFTSDHGELFGEHNRFGHDQDVLYQKQLHVPLIIKTYGNNKKVFDKPASLVNIPSTFLEILKIKNSYFDTESIFKENEYVISEGIIWSSFEKQQTIKKNEIMVSCQKENWKLIIDNIHNRKELYNLADDPDESSNLYPSMKDVAGKLSKIIESHLNKSEEKDLITNKIKLLRKAGKI